jgi:hypothetical protein
MPAFEPSAPSWPRDAAFARSRRAGGCCFTMSSLAMPSSFIIILSCAQPMKAATTTNADSKVLSVVFMKIS